MTHYRMNDNTVSAIVLSKNKRTGSFDESRKYHNNTIFMDDGTEFSIRLFNPTVKKVGVKVGINKEFSSSYIVLNPGESLNLERFIDTQRKMIFETYTVDGGNQQVQKAIANNGIVEILFFNEKQYRPSTVYTSFNTKNYNTRCYDKSVLGRKTSISGQCFNSPSVPYTETDNSTLGSTKLTSNTTNNVYYDSGMLFSADLEMSLTSDVNYSDTKSIDFAPIEQQNLIETGRIEKGGQSEQNFTEVQVEFENTPFQVITYQLKPTSTRTEYDKEIRNYCEICGYRIKKSSYLYCPKCGNKL